MEPPSAPHFGGAHESLVRTTKLALYRALGVEEVKSRYPTDEVLRTLLWEVAALLNSRPLTYVSSDVGDARILTPNDFLGKSPLADTTQEPFEDALPAERYRYTQRLANLFWDHWIKLYLPSLISRRKWKMKGRDFQPGDFVLIADPNQHRGQLKSGLITAVHPGADGCVRVVDVKTKEAEYRRRIHRLCLLRENLTNV